jgi:hypothetical protein
MKAEIMRLLGSCDFRKTSSVVIRPVRGMDANICLNSGAFVSYIPCEDDELARKSIFRVIKFRTNLGQLNRGLQMS